MKFRMLACLLATAVSMLAADVNGKWTATMQGRNGNSREVTYNLKVDGDKLTGTQSTPMGDRQLENGKVEGDTVSWTQTMNFQGESRTATYTGKVDGDTIHAKMKAGEMEREFEMKRAK